MSENNAIDVAACPSAERLWALLEGSQPESGGTAVHVQNCATCQGRLEQLCAAGDELVLALRENSPVPVDEIHNFQRAMDRFLGGADVGRQLGEYVLLEKVGQGGMGAVFRARHARLDKVVALKLVAPGRSRDPAMLARFAREMKATGRLHHPNIVQATDAGEADGVPYLVMEYISGGADLAQLVKRRGRLPVADACAAIRQAALGIHHAHESGLVHRDVKPSNLLLTRDGTVKVLDLGLALLAGESSGFDAAESPSETTDPGADSLTSASLIVGTRHYMAPEQKRDAHNLDPRADVYGLGRTLCYLLTGAPVPAALPGVPRSLQTIIARMTAEQPAERYSTAADTANALRRFSHPADLTRLLDGNGPIAPLASHRAWWLAAATVLLAAGLITWAVLTKRANDSTGQVAGGNDESRPTPVAVAAVSKSKQEDMATAVDLPKAPPMGRLPFDDKAAKELQDEWARHCGVPVEIKPDIGPRLQLIPPGEVGVTTELRVRITRPYYLGAYEVTRGEYAAFVAATGYKTQPERNGRGATLAHFVQKNGRWSDVRETRPEYKWYSPGTEDSSDEHPVTCIGWVDATAYCEWLSKTTGETYRLPSMAEWVWAARAGDGRSGQLPIMRDYTWLSDTAREPQPVGRKLPNPWGIFDMIGNVAEYLRDGTIPPPAGTRDDYVAAVTKPQPYRAVAGISHMTGVANYEYQSSTHETVGASTFNGFRVVREIAKPPEVTSPP